MNIEIRAVDRKDYSKAIQFAIKGMHFDWYLNSRFLLNAYGRYFWYLEMNRATHVYAAYADSVFVGVLLAEIYGEKKAHQVWYEKLYVKFVDIIQKLFFSGGAGLYDDTIKCSDKLKLDTEGVETGHGKTYSEKDTDKKDRGVQ